jgi:hypothetical protein
VSARVVLMLAGLVAGAAGAAVGVLFVWWAA